MVHYLFSYKTRFSSLKNSPKILDPAYDPFYSERPKLCKISLLNMSQLLKETICSHRSKFLPLRSTLNEKEQILAFKIKPLLVVFAVFSNGCHLGFLAWLNFTILIPCCLLLLLSEGYVAQRNKWKFTNPSCFPFQKWQKKIKWSSIS